MNILILLIEIVVAISLNIRLIDDCKAKSVEQCATKQILWDLKCGWLLLIEDFLLLVEGVYFYLLDTF